MPRKLKPSERALRDLHHRGFPFDPQPAKAWHRYIVDVLEGLEDERGEGASIREEQLCKPVLKLVGYSARSTTREYLERQIIKAAKSLANRGILERYSTDMYMRYRLVAGTEKRRSSLKRPTSSQWHASNTVNSANQPSTANPDQGIQAHSQKPRSSNVRDEDEASAIDRLERLIRRDLDIGSTLLGESAESETEDDVINNEDDDGWQIEQDDHNDNIDDQSMSALNSFIGDDEDLSAPLHETSEAQRSTTGKHELIHITASLHDIEWESTTRRAAGRDPNTNRSLTLRMGTDGSLHLQVEIDAEEAIRIMHWNATHWPGIPIAQRQSGATTHCHITIDPNKEQPATAILAHIDLIEDITNES